MTKQINTDARANSIAQMMAQMTAATSVAAKGGTAKEERESADKAFDQFVPAKS